MIDATERVPSSSRTVLVYSEEGFVVARYEKGHWRSDYAPDLNLHVKGWVDFFPLNSNESDNSIEVKKGIGGL